MSIASSHSPNLIQSFAGVLVCGRDLTIQAFSNSLSAMTGVGDKLKIGASVADVFGRQIAHDARGWGQTLEVTGQEPTTFAYQIEQKCFDISCQGGPDMFSFTFEPSPGGRQFPVDSITRRILQRVRGQASRQQALDAATRTMRLSLRAEAVWLYEVRDEHGLVLQSQDCVQGIEPRQPDINAEITCALTAGAGVVPDYEDAGSELVCQSADIAARLPVWLNRPSAPLLAFLTQAHTRSAHWYAVERSGKRLMCLLVEHASDGAADCARRQATRLAFEIMLLAADAEHPHS